MAIYQYRGRNPAGGAVDGTLQAGSRDMAISQLMQKGITTKHVGQRFFLVGTHFCVSIPNPCERPSLEFH